MTIVDTIRAEILAGVNLEELASEYDVTYEAEANEIILPGWVASMDGVEVYYPEADNAREAIVRYVDWEPEELKTEFCAMITWRRAIDADGDEVSTCEGETTYPLDPVEPDCPEGEHSWVDCGNACHGGGYLCFEKCTLCGMGKTTDTWAQDPSTGEQGLDSVEYIPGED